MLCGLAGAQDKMKLLDGTIIKCRVSKIANGKIFYQKFSSAKTPIVDMPKSQVEYIKYESGKVVYMDKKVKVKKAATTKTPAKKK
jgi:hypothetical protein